MAKVNQAVILAAGRGTRLGKEGVIKPKGFITLGKKTIIEESIIRLQRAGITKIFLVTGHKAEFYETLSAEYDELIQTAKNPVYATSGSFYSLFMLDHLISEDFLLLESDLIYEQRALTTLQNDPRPDVILLSGETCSGDEIYVECHKSNDNLLLHAMSKNRDHLGPTIAGELVGISKVSLMLFTHMMKIAKPLFKKTLHFEYEAEGFVRASQSHPIYCTCIDDLAWSEIDDVNHLQRAKELIYPRLENTATCQ